MAEMTIAELRRLLELQDKHTEAYAKKQGIPPDRREKYLQTLAVRRIEIVRALQRAVINQMSSRADYWLQRFGE